MSNNEIKKAIEFRCPHCGSSAIAEILYGMPAFSEELQRDLENKRIVLGGCMIMGDDPEHYCWGCGKEF